MGSCVSASGVFVAHLHNHTSCELTGNTYSGDTLLVEAKSTFNGDITVGRGADVQIGSKVNDGSVVHVLAPSTFNSNVTFDSVGGSVFTVGSNTSAELKASLDVGGAVGLYGPSLVVQGNSTFISQVVMNSDVTLGDHFNDTLTVGANSFFDGNATFGTDVHFADAAGLGATLVSISLMQTSTPMGT
jgi:hypothetical protein